MKRDNVMGFHNVRRQRGNALVESALTGIIFLTVLFGVVGFGRAMWAYSWTAHAAREASRYASVRGAKSGQAPDIAGLVTSNMMGLDASQVTVTPQWLPDNEPGSVVQVTVQYTVTQLVPWVPAITVQSTSRMPIAQ